MNAIDKEINRLLAMIVETKDHDEANRLLERLGQLARYRPLSSSTD